MRARSSIGIGMVIALCVTLVGAPTRADGGGPEPIASSVAAGDPAGTRPTTTIQAAPTTIRGVLRTVVVDHPDGEQLVHLLEDDAGTWWLDGLDDLTSDRLSPGALVSVSGTVTEPGRLRVASVDVLGAGMTVSSSTSSAALRSTRVLVIRVHWSTRPPANPTAAATRKKVIRASRDWFREVSGGRYAVSGAVTRWLRVPRPTDCYGSFPAVGSAAVDAARRAGYAVGSFSRYVIYMPCSAGGIAGVATLGGNHVWLFGNVRKNVVVHEQGHNLGLRHASSRECRGGRSWPTTTWSGSCSVIEYGDVIDAMGNRRAGHYNAYFKHRLGWLRGLRTVTSSTRITLRPHTSTGPGRRAIRLRTSRRTYWLEYRTRSGADSALPKGTAGLQVRLQQGTGSQLLDAAPGSAGFDDFGDVHLPVGSSWTTPERVRITVLKQTSSAVTVRIRFRAGAPTAPSVPLRVGAAPTVRGARISWRRPRTDGGAIVRRYVITRRDNGATRTVGRDRTSYTWSGLNPSRSYRFTVRAVNEVGRSSAASSDAVRPKTDAPSLRIDAPVAGAVVAGRSWVDFTAARNPTTKAALGSATLRVDGRIVADDYFPPFDRLSWSTLAVADGEHTIRVTVTDTNGRQASDSRTVVVANPAPVRITSPADGATVATTTDVEYALAPALDDWWSVELLVDGAAEQWAVPGEPLPFEPVWYGPGSHQLRVRAEHQDAGTLTSAPITVHVPTPTVGIAVPAPGASLSGPFQVTPALSAWDWSWVELYVDGEYAGAAYPGDPVESDTAWFDPGAHDLTVVAWDDWGRQFTSPATGVTFT
jgi:hypothetical protein